VTVAVTAAAAAAAAVAAAAGSARQAGSARPGLVAAGPRQVAGAGGDPGCGPHQLADRAGTLPFWWAVVSDLPGIAMPKKSSRRRMCASLHRPFAIDV
jgi:hypothetical protein